MTRRSSTVVSIVSFLIIAAGIGRFATVRLAHQSTQFATVTELAGFAICHAATAVSAGEALCTLAMGQTAAPFRALSLFRVPDLNARQAVALAMKKLSTNDSLDRWVLVWDGYLVSANGKRDALLAEVHESGQPDFGVALCYEPPHQGKPFALCDPPLFFEGTVLIDRTLNKAGEMHLVQEPRERELRLNHGMRLHPDFATLHWKNE
jgi:hypothetical protein